jgi:hypothetical protein
MLYGLISLLQLKKGQPTSNLLTQNGLYRRMRPFHILNCFVISLLEAKQDPFRRFCIISLSFQLEIFCIIPHYYFHSALQRHHLTGQLVQDCWRGQPGKDDHGRKEMTGRPEHDKTGRLGCGNQDRTTVTVQLGQYIWKGQSGQVSLDRVT